MTALLINVTAALTMSLFAARLRRRTRAAVRHALLAGGFGVLIALPVAATIAPKVAVPIPIDLSVATREVTATPGGEQRAGSVMTDGAMTAAVPDNPRPFRVSLGTLLISVWIAGTVALLMPVFAGLVEIRRLRRQARPEPALERLVSAASRGAGLRRRFDVLTHDGLVGPITFGIRRPVVILPASAIQWTEDDVNRALLHELEHVRRGDWLTHCVARAVCAAYWFHPMVWMAWRELVFEAERACDDAVVTRADAERYADQLLSLAQRLSARRQPHLAMANRRDLSRRVLAVLNEAQPRGRADRRCLAGIVAAAVLLTGLLTPLQWVARAATPGPIPLLQIQDPPAATQQERPGLSPTFEVASVRRNGSGDPQPIIQVLPGGSFRATNVALRGLIRYAYRLQDFELDGGPSWQTSERFDVFAKASGDASVEDIRLMLRTLLTRRFGLELRRETRTLPAYALVVTSTDGRPGAQLRRSNVDCGAASSGDVGPINADSSRPCGYFGPAAGTSLASGRSKMAMRGLSMEGFARLLAPVVRRAVIDRTRLQGYFDGEFEFTAELGPPPPPPGFTDSLDRPSLPSIFAVLPEQLGLKLEPTRAAAEVVIIDKVEPPTPD